MNCPECNERLNPQARRCACGWQNPVFHKPERKASEKHWDPRCTFTHAGMRCHHPVGFYDVGQETGWCIFHRSVDAKEHPQQCAEIVRESSEFSRDAYLDAARKFVNGKGVNNPELAALAERAAKIHATLKDKRFFDEALQRAA